MGPIRIWKIIFGSGSETLVVSSSKPQQRLLTTLTEYNLVNASLIKHERLTSHYMDARIKFGRCYQSTLSIFR